MESSVRTTVYFRMVAFVVLVGILTVLLYLFGKPAIQKMRKTREIPSSAKTTPMKKAQVSIVASGFSPATILIKKGTAVTWVNNDRVSHRVASDPHPAHSTVPGLDSETDLAQGDSFVFTFDETGTFSYHDHLNPLTLKGTVLVE